MLMSKGGHERIVRPDLPYFDPVVFRDGQAAAEDCVCRILISDGAVGTGFLVAPDLVLTNYHVVEGLIRGQIPPERFVFQFDDRRLSDGSRPQGVRLSLAADGTQAIDWSPSTPEEDSGQPEARTPGLEHLDYALLRLERPIGEEPSVHASQGAPVPRGWVSLAETPPPIAQDMPLFILQHPDGSPLSLAFDTSAVLEVRAGGTRVRYRVNTERGSSGSPVFDAKWRIVALHHYGDPAYNHPRYNQGVPIKAILARLAAQGHAALLRRPPPRTMERLATRVGTELRTVAALPADQAMRNALIPYREGMRGALDSIQLLDTYKTLHANLHKIQMRLLPVSVAIDEMRKGHLDYARMVPWETREMERWLEAAEIAAMNLRPTQRVWIPRARAATQRLATAAVNKDAHFAATALEELRGLQQVAIGINSLLAFIAGRLPLHSIGSALERVAVALGSVGSGDGPARSILEGKQALDQLAARLAELVHQHDMWQSLDTELSAADPQALLPPGQRFPNWAAFRAGLVDLCALYPAAAWSVELVGHLTTWEGSAGAGKTEAAEASFVALSNACKWRFYEVDEELRAACKSLGTITEPLGAVLERA